MRRFVSAAVALLFLVLTPGWVGRLGAAPDPSCDRDARPVKTPPAALSPALSAKYPNGVLVELNFTVSTSGKLTGTKSDAPADLNGTIAAWSKNAEFAPAAKACKPVASTVSYYDVSFYPQASGVAGLPQIVGGVDFGNLRYSGGPGNCTTSPMHNGTYEDPELEYTASVEDLFGGSVAGQPVAVVILRCEYNGHGYDAMAQLFAIAGGTARRLGILGTGGLAASDSSMPPGGWIHLSFTDGKLYADVWDSAQTCASRRDWVSSAYTIRDGKLVRLDQLRHHRPGIACSE
jgi:hypothetical protein